MKTLSTAILFCFIILCSFAQKEPVEPYTEEQLGQALFFDPILSLDSTISCASCHKPEFAFADTVAFSKGVGDSLGIRNTPSVMNITYRPFYFYDGKVTTLEEQAIFPIENPIEMHLDFKEALRRLQGSELYNELFKQVFQDAPDSSSLVRALASFQSTLESDGSAPHDQWISGNNPDALSPSQLRGREIYFGKAKCSECHFGVDFTNDEFRNIGLYDGKELNDTGRFAITKDSSDLGKFKTPGLRNVALTAPYMHNGQFKTLEEVIDFYNQPYNVVSQPINMDTLMLNPLHLSQEEKTDLVDFLHTLTDETFNFSMN